MSSITDGPQNLYRNPSDECIAHKTEDHARACGLTAVCFELFQDDDHLFKDNNEPFRNNKWQRYAILYEAIAEVIGWRSVDIFSMEKLVVEGESGRIEKKFFGNRNILKAQNDPEIFRECLETLAAIKRIGNRCKSFCLCLG